MSKRFRAELPYMDQTTYQEQMMERNTEKNGPGSLLTHLPPIFILLLIATFILGSSNESGVAKIKSTPSTVDSFIIGNVYLYRTISAQYDSMVASCVWGEIVTTVNGQDSVTVQPSTFTAHPGETGQAYDISQGARTTPFYVTTSTELSVFRMLFIQQLTKSYPYFLPDTVTWSLELWSSTSETKLATLDSVGFYGGRGSDTADFPEAFGFINPYGGTFDRLVYQMENYLVPGSGNDYVYLRFRMTNTGVQDAGLCNLYDMDVFNVKFSGDLTYSKQGDHGAAKASITDFNIKIGPNPVSTQTRLYLGSRFVETVHISLVTEDGRLVKALWNGRSGDHTQVVPIDVSSIPSGTYFISLRGESTGKSKLSRLVVVH